MVENPPLDKLLTPEETAEALRVKIRTVMEWLRQGKLKGVKLGGKLWRVKESDLRAFIKQWEQTQGEASPESGDGHGSPTI